MNDALIDYSPAVRTVAHRLMEHAQSCPGSLCYRFLRDGVAESGVVSFGQLDQRAREIAVRLNDLGLKRGDRALLLLPSCLDFMTSFFGCLYAGVLAVPLYQMSANQPGNRLPRLQAIFEDAEPRTALCLEKDHATTAAMLADLPGLASLPLLEVDAVAEEGAERWRDPGVTSDDICFLQYTSGSTARPKGVMVSHGNLMANSALLAAAFEQGPDQHQVSWLPLFHDMGLIGTVLQTLQTGSSCTFMPPLAFLRRPLRWLKAIERYGARVSGGPNFAYELCVRKIKAEAREELDLSCWDLAFCGAEPVRRETMDSFAQMFAPCGLKETALYPCYGLAESTLFVSGGSRHEPPVLLTLEKDKLESHQASVASAEGKGAVTLVGSGRCWEGMRIEIVDPATEQLCPEGKVGEIWLQSPSVAQGYWQLDDLTDRTFRAEIVGLDERRFLRTGDLGFLNEGELFVTGRLKDLIIINGQNHYPQDIEHTAVGSHPGLRPGGCVAFSVDETGKELLVVVAEVTRGVSPVVGSAAEADEAALQAGRLLDAVELEHRLRRLIVEQHELFLHDLALIKAGGLPKTSSGKVQRNLCRAMYAAGELKLWDE